MIRHTTTKLTDAFVQAELLTLTVGESSNAVAIPEGHTSLVITNPSHSLKEEVWVSFGSKDAKVVACVGVGHKLQGGDRLHVLATPGIAQIAAILAPSRADGGAKIIIECGAGGETERRHH